MTQEAKGLNKNEPAVWWSSLGRRWGDLRRVMTLFTNHMDAWVVTAVISFTALLFHDQLTGRGFLLLFAITTLYWFGFALNDYHDVTYDAQDEKKARSNFFVQFPTAAKHGKTLFLTIAGLLVIAFVPFGVRGLAVLAVLFWAAWAYSSPPLRVKSRPGWDLLMHATFVESFPYFATIFLLRAPWLSIDVVAIFLLMIASLGAQLEQQSRDFEVDSKSDRNFTTTVGLPTTQLLLKIVNSLMIIIVVVGIAARMVPRLYVPLLLTAAPIVLHRFFRKPDQPRSELLVNVSAIAAGTYAVVLLLLNVFG